MSIPPTPDPTQGLFETVLVLDRAPVALSAHLDRLAASLASLFSSGLPPGLADDVAQRARELRLGRVRIVVDRAGTGAKLTAEEVDPVDFFPGRDRAVELRSLQCADGLGAHKWADRGFLAEAPGEPVPLLVDAGDEVLEAGRGNVFAAFGETLRTPALDGRILPGTARASAIEVAHGEGIEVREGRLTHEDLFAADEVFLTGSVRGVEPVGSLDGAPLPAGDRLSRRLAEALLRRWRTGPLAVAGS